MFLGRRRAAGSAVQRRDRAAASSRNIVAASFTVSVRPYAVSVRADQEPSPRHDWYAPVTTSTVTDVNARREKRVTVSYGGGVCARWRVSRRAVRPPSQAAIASRCSTDDVMATGTWIPADACSADAHVSARPTARTAPAVTRVRCAARRKKGTSSAAVRSSSTRVMRAMPGRPLSVSGKLDRSSAVPGDVPFSYGARRISSPAVVTSSVHQPNSSGARSGPVSGGRHRAANAAVPMSSAAAMYAR